jgi:tRNA A-37 threonylcarbamoyl transferase component Bud32
VLTRAARLALGKHGIREGIPQVADIIRIEHEEDGLCELGDPFTVNETMYIITMQEIQALNVERIILEYGENTYDMKKVTANLAEILGTLHKEGIYHKDLSLRNVLIDPVTSEVWVIDFGAAEHRNTKDETLAASDMDQCSKMLRWLERYKADPEGTRVDLEAKYGKD